MLFDHDSTEEVPGADLSFSRGDANTRHEVSPQTFDASSKNHTKILRGLDRFGQREMARAMGVTDSTISRMKDDTHRLGSPLARTAHMLALMGYKLVPIEAKCFMELED